MTFQEKLIAIRKVMRKPDGKHITQDDIASIAGVTRQAVYKWESGQSYPEVITLIKVRDFFKEYGSKDGLIPEEITLDNLLDDSFSITIPDKKRRRRKADREIQREIETIVEADGNAERTIEELLASLSAPAAPAAVITPAAAPAAPAAPVVEEAAPVAEEAPAAVVVEEPAPEEDDEDLEAEAAEAPVAEEEEASVAEETPAAEEKPKKKGFLWFGRK